MPASPGTPPPPPVNAKTARLSRGRHRSPETGACVMELASMLAGEPFSDHPSCACPVIAAFLRTYNDGLGDRDRNELLPYAAMVVGSAAGRRERRRRVATLLAWGYPDHSARRRRAMARMLPAASWASGVAEIALRRHLSRRRAEVDALLRELLGVEADEPLGKPVARLSRGGV